MVIIIFTSNLLLSHFYGYPLFGWWTLFTYSGCIAMILLGTQLSPQPQFTRTIVFTMGVSLGYWLWTNFGVWLFTEMYPKTLEGLSACYTAALPFLRSALLGTIIWMLILLSMTHVIRWINQRPWQSLSKHILI